MAMLTKRHSKGNALVTGHYQHVIINVQLKWGISTTIYNCLVLSTLQVDLCFMMSYPCINMNPIFSNDIGQQSIFRIGTP